MAENKEKSTVPEPENNTRDGNEKVGDMLRKERLTRRITIETIAKDLKLNVAYIKALEASDYSALPVDPYVRVYIKSLTKYLSLDTDAVMKQFYREQGLIDDDKTANKIDISVQKPDKNLTLVIAAALIVALAIFALIANQKGWLTPPPHTATTAAEKPDSLMNDLESAHQANLDSAEAAALAANNNPDDSVRAAKAPPRP